MPRHAPAALLAALPLAAALLLQPRPAGAMVYKVEVTARVVTIGFDTLGIAVGDLMTGWFIYDAAAVQGGYDNAAGSLSQQVYPAALLDALVTVDGFSSGALLATGATNVLLNHATGNADPTSLVFNGITYGGDLRQVGLALLEGTTDLLADLSLPDPVPESGWVLGDSGVVSQLNATTGGPDSAYYGADVQTLTVTALPDYTAPGATPMPEPAGWALLGVALPLLGWRRGVRRGARRNWRPRW